MSSIRLGPPKKWSDTVSISLPLSKSISNRVLILNALSEGKIKSDQYSMSNDTLVLRTIIEDHNLNIYDAQDAGTVFRFLTAYAAFKNKAIILTGSGRMKERPIMPLVNALKEMGANISYLEKENFPPIEIKPTKDGLNSKEEVKINDTSSSQYISALMLIGPFLENGLKIKIPENLPSYSYLEMTAGILGKCGYEFELDESSFSIKNQTAREIIIQSEPDWSNASYFISLMVLGKWNTIFLEGLQKDSIQGDYKILDFLRPFGLEYNWSKNGLSIERKLSFHRESVLEFDFSQNPDLSITVIVLCALLKRNVKIRGLENLVYKESNRIEAMATELLKINCNLSQVNDYWLLESQSLSIPKSLSINTYKDHRIAMAFSLISMISELEILDSSVVNKSFPNFWKEIQKLGLILS